MSPPDPLPLGAEGGALRTYPARPRLLVAHRDHTPSALFALFGEELGFQSFCVYHGADAHAQLVSLRPPPPPIVLLVHVGLPGLYLIQPKPDEPVIFLLEHVVALPPALASWRMLDVIVGPPSPARLRVALTRLPR